MFWDAGMQLREPFEGFCTKSDIFRIRITAVYSQKTFSRLALDAENDRHCDKFH
jgi:hypothetical protein